MRLLLDENISWRLAALIQSPAAEVVHVRDVGLGSRPDTSIWQYASQQRFHLLTKDEDFVRLLLDRGFPPQIIVVNNAQVPVAQLAGFLLSRWGQIQDFWAEQQTVSGMLVLRMP